MEEIPREISTAWFGTKKEISEYIEKVSKKRNYPQEVLDCVKMNFEFAYSKANNLFTTDMECSSCGNLLIINNTKLRELKCLNRSEEHTSELQSHSFISYAVFCLKKKKKSTKKRKSTKNHQKLSILSI